MVTAVVHVDGSKKVQCIIRCKNMMEEGAVQMLFALVDKTLMVVRDMEIFGVVIYKLLLIFSVKNKIYCCVFSILWKKKHSTHSLTRTKFLLIHILKKTFLHRTKTGEKGLM